MKMNKTNRLGMRVDDTTYKLLLKLQLELKDKFNVVNVSQADCLEYLLKEYYKD